MRVQKHSVKYLYTQLNVNRLSYQTYLLWKDTNKKQKNNEQHKPHNDTDDNDLSFFSYAQIQISVFTPGPDVTMLTPEKDISLCELLNFYTHIFYNNYILFFLCGCISLSK